jgi:hypothetical protein
MCDTSALTTRSQTSNLVPLRILEVGALQLFATAVPDQTKFYWTGTKPRGFVQAALGPICFIKTLIRLRRREFDLLVIHNTQYAPWHPRSALTTLRDWHVRSPLGLFATFAWRFIHLFHDVPIAAVDLDDSCLIGSHSFHLLDRCRAFFKRELPSDHWLAFCNAFPGNKFPGRNRRSRKSNSRRIEKLRPISLGVYQTVAPTHADKKADIFFAGSLDANSTVRVSGLKELELLASQGYVIDIPKQPLQHEEFLQRMANSWLAWSPGGLGWDCYRHYEALLVGTVPLTNNPTIMRHRPLRDKEHCIFYYVERGGLAEAARKALADKPHLREMAVAGAKHVKRHHSAYARADYIASTVLGVHLDGRPVSADAEQ